MTSNSSARDLAAPLKRMTLLTGLLVLSVGLIGSVTTVTGTITAKGLLIRSKPAAAVLAKTGGIVASLRVKDGDTVASGDSLFTLDTTALERTLSRITRDITIQHLREARLNTTAEGSEALIVPKDVRESAATQGLDALVASERARFEADRDALEGERARLSREQWRTRAQILALDAEISAKEQEISIIKKEIDIIRKPGTGAAEDQLKIRNLEDKLMEQRLLALERERARLLGELQRIKSTRNNANSQRAELERRLEHLDKDTRRRALADLAEVTAKLRTLGDDAQNLKQEIEACEVRATSSGTVTEIAIEGQGSRVEAGMTVMRIADPHERLMIEAEISPRDIGAISLGQQARIKIASSRSEVAATIADIRAEKLRDAGRERSTFLVRLAPEQRGDDQSAALTVTGAPVEVVIETTASSTLAYILRPLTEALSHPAPR